MFADSSDNAVIKPSASSRTGFKPAPGCAPVDGLTQQFFDLLCVPDFRESTVGELLFKQMIFELDAG